MGDVEFMFLFTDVEFMLEGYAGGTHEIHVEDWINNFVGSLDDTDFGDVLINMSIKLWVLGMKWYSWKSKMWWDYKFWWLLVIIFFEYCEVGFGWVYNWIVTLLEICNDYVIEWSYSGWLCILDIRI